MICDRILGHINEFSTAEREIDELELTWQECGRRFLRKASRGGREVGLLLPVASRLRGGEVVCADVKLIIHIRVLPARVLVIAVRTMDESASIAYELGSLHCPVQFTPTEIIIPADDPMEALLRRWGIRFKLDMREFQPMEPVEGLRVEVKGGFALK